MINKKDIRATNGLNYIYDPGLAFATVLRVAMEGKQHNVSDLATGNLLCRYSTGEGRIYFENIFAFNEKVSIIYKT